MELLNQPFNGQLGNRLIQALDSDTFQSLTIVVAFAKNSGVLRLKDSLTKFRARGGSVNVYLGVDLGGTSYEALTNLRTHVDSLWVVHSDRGQTFHTKIYNFVGEEQALVMVGSHNLTGGGLWTNFENSVIVTVPLDSGQQPNLQNQVADFLGNLNSLGAAIMPIESQDDIEKLLDAGYVGKEVTQRILAKNQPKPLSGTPRLFGKAAPAPIPKVIPSGKTSRSIAAVESVHGSNVSEEPTIWFEAGKMTGGSRNILDLSMKSLVERGDPAGTPFEHTEPGFMRGGVEFFGLDPLDTSVRKEVTLNFEGVDYSGNTILFPAGSSANGTWRLQIKGMDAFRRKITEAFRTKGEEHYLVEKVIAFTRVPGDYFYLTVFPAADLEDFVSASRILARNGATVHSRRLGLL